ncbi:hypothetical protein, partial [Sphingobium phenoxybenzoativorans]|uniref:hypothetical protein n=1 Tax=Sphingobium phenoxybenzoativorans TaxID=1592790 RepID=UPI001C0BA760
MRERHNGHGRDTAPAFIGGHRLERVLHGFGPAAEHTHRRPLVGRQLRDLADDLCLAQSAVASPARARSPAATARN